ncbi:MAG TPA: hypothetical protein VFG03_21240 [Telluria sp.]|nr:hypothetical protein [Telluria sp.]
MSNERDCQCGQPQRACSTEFQYAVKLVHGVVAANANGAPTPVAPGRYWTAINLHNPDKCRDAHFRWKVVIAPPSGLSAGVPVYQRPQALGPDLVLEIDGQQVSASFPPPVPPFLKGYVVIESDIELDVVAVYSGTQGGTTRLSNFHTERVHPRCVPVCEDLVMPLHTGLADWQTVAPTPGPLGPVAPLNPFVWRAPPFGSAWVSQLASDASNAPPGIRYYEFCFNLCSGFTTPARFPIQVLVDNAARVLLNGSQLANIPDPGFNTPTTVSVNPGFLRPGRNCFRIDVNNFGGPTGFALAGMLRVARGKCPCGPPGMTGSAPSPGGAAAPEDPQSIESPEQA